jgi:glycosyltransferase involved in cell wall biosynthesis
VLHSYLALGVAARLLGARVVIEFHEVQDTGELRRRLAAAYARHLIGPLLRLVDGVVVHSRHDLAVLTQAYRIGGKPYVITPHGPYDHHLTGARHAADMSEPLGFDPAPGLSRLLFFGTIRPYKGLEDLIEAYDSLAEEDAERLALTVVGETWEGWTLPERLIQRSRRASRIRFVNRYVDDAEVAAAFAAADAVVLPYRRSSSSGPLHIAMSHGLPVVVTAVGGLVEAVSRYRGAVLVPPGHPAALADALRGIPAMTGRRYPDPHSWDVTVDAYAGLLDQLGRACAVPATRPCPRAGEAAG